VTSASDSGIDPGGEGPVGTGPPESGRSGRFFARIFENPDNPLGWSLRLLTLAGISIRVHLFTVVFVAVMLLWSIPPAHAGVVFMSLAMVSLMAVVIVHELGHCFATRLVGGAADRIVLMPFGGLSLVRPARRWRDHFISAAGGPLANLVILPITAGALWSLGLGRVIVFNPLAPIAEIGDPAFSASSTALVLLKVGVWWLHYMNIVVLGLNMLLPAYPLDGGRLFHALLWSRMSWRHAAEATVVAGFAVAMLLVLAGFVLNASIVVILGALTGWASWLERRRIRGEDEIGAAGLAVGAALSPGLEPDPWALKAAAKRRKAQQEEQREVDRILDKISTQGMDSLSREERRALERATSRRKKEGPPPGR